MTDDGSGKMADVTGQRYYQGRGKVVGIAGKNYPIREEKTDRLIEVGPNSDDEIRPLQFHYPTLTLGDQRAFLEKHKDAPDEIPVTVALPLSFFSNLDDLPTDHPESKAVSESYSVAASENFFEAIHESGDSADRYFPLEEREGENWDFSVEIVPHAEDCFYAMHEFGE